MKIKYKNNGNFIVEFNEYFKTINDLKIFIKENNKFINVDLLNDTIEKIYKDLTLLDHSVKSSILPWFIVEQFKFNFKRPNNLNFWLERGYGLTEFNEYNKSDKLKPLDDNEINKFQFKSLNFELKGKPTCNLCSSDLIIKPTIGRYEIIGCSNDKCITHVNNTILRVTHLAFLPLDVYNKKNSRINLNYKNCIEYWLLKGCNYEDALCKVKEIKKQISEVSVGSIEYYRIVSELNDNEIKDLLSEYTHLSIKYWVNKGYSEEESIKIISELQSNNSNKGVGLRKQFPERYSAITETQIGYWLKKGFNQEESLLILNKRQSTFTLDKCIEKYGEDEGIKRFNDRQAKWQKSLSDGGNLKIGYSKISQDLFYDLLESYNNEEKDKIYFATHNKEYVLEKENGGLWLYDFTDIKNKKIIEYNGDEYHGNPDKFKAEDNPHPFRKNVTAQEIWNKDKLKIDVAIKNGFEVLTIWDSEYRWGNKKEIINKCINFINNK